MIIKLSNEQIALFWDEIKYAIIHSNPIPRDLGEYCTNKVLENLLTNKFQCWLVYTLDEEGKKQIHAISLTSIVTCNLFNYNVLVIDTLYGLRPFTDELAIDSINGLKEFAKLNNCYKLQAETMNERIIELMELTGFKQESVKYSIPL